MSMPTTHQHRAIRYALALVVVTQLGYAGSTFPTGEYVSGRVTMRFGDGGSAHVTSGDKAVVEAVYSTQADEIRITDKSGPWACTAKGEETGVYRWKYADGMLTLTAVEDRCSGRLGDLTRPWKRKN